MDNDVKYQLIQFIRKEIGEFNIDITDTSPLLVFVHQQLMRQQHNKYEVHHK